MGTNSVVITPVRIVGIHRGDWQTSEDFTIAAAVEPSNYVHSTGGGSGDDL